MVAAWGSNQKWVCEMVAAPGSGILSMYKSMLPGAA
jgi:hypothetical protein